jgi:hypothetical protein
VKRVPPPAKRVPIGDLIDLQGGDLRSPRELRARLPRGWVLDEDGLTAHRDLRLLFREGWILLVGLAAFGAVAVALFRSTLPPGWAPILRLAAMVLALLLVGGLVAPVVTRALARRR